MYSGDEYYPDEITSPSEEDRQFYRPTAPPIPVKPPTTHTVEVPSPDYHALLVRFNLITLKLLNK